VVWCEMIKTHWKKDPNFRIWYLMLGKLFIGEVSRNGEKAWGWKVTSGLLVNGMEKTRREAKRQLERAVIWGLR
jgi:hypothetical protein